MKTLFSILFILFVSIGINAQTLIAVHNETGSSFYSNLDSAIVNSVAGDFIYLPGGSFKISKPINKKLQIVGVGHNPDSCMATGITQITGNFVINSTSGHGSIIGLKINGDIIFTAGQTVTYFSIERCNLNSVSLTSQSTNILFNECGINGSIAGNSSQGIHLTKCIIGGNVGGFIANTTINNNVFFKSTFTYPTGGCFFKNNIFLSNGPTPNPGYTALYQNNSFANLVSSIHNCHNNIMVAVADLFGNKSFDYDQDYHLLSTSPARNAGTDGTDLGIYGTGSPWKEGSVPGNPHIQTKMISTIDSKPNVKIKVAAQDN